MKTTRVGIFETNSSSSHSLSLGEGCQVKGNDDKDTIVLGTGDYGWGYDTLTTWLERADYLGVEARDDEEKKERLVKTIHSMFPNLVIEFSEEGYIDHQSSGEIWTECNSEQSLFYCVFGNTEITIDNDNH